MQPTMLLVPPIQQEGVTAAIAGTRMSSFGAPMGFVFCPYRDGSVEKWNFLVGATHAYMGDEA